ncbi:MAG: type II toxin-antitoxin system RelE/ParE family toxin [Candidatus Sericytochromatia bacterium]
MHIFKTKLFDRWAKDEGLTDQALAAAVCEMNSGLVDAALGGNVYKKRVAKPGKGKSGSYRTLLAIKLQDKAFFLYGFSKNQRANISSKELIALKRLAAELLGYSETQLAKAIDKGELSKVEDNE